MPTMLTLDQMKSFVKNHFEDFVNKRNAAVIHMNMTSDFYDHDDQVENLLASMVTKK